MSDKTTPDEEAEAFGCLVRLVYAWPYEPRKDRRELCDIAFKEREAHVAEIKRLRSEVEFLRGKLVTQVAATTDLHHRVIESEGSADA